MTRAAPGRDVAILLLALGLRLGWAVWAARDGTALRYPDEQLHWQIATRLVDSGQFVTEDGRRAARMPAYPVLLAASATLGETGVHAARAMQVLLGAATAWLALCWGRAAGGPRAGRAAGLFVACDPYGIFFTALLLNETLFAFLLTAGGFAAWHSATHSSRAFSGAAIAAAACGTLALLTRPEALLWTAMIAIVLAAGARNWRGRAARLALCAALVAAGLLPWGVRNTRVLGEAAWLGTNGGVTLYDGQGPQARGDSDQSFLATMPELNDLSEVQRDRRLRTLAIEEMTDDPGRVARLALTKFARTWNPFPNAAEHRGAAAAWAGAAHSIVVIALAGAALILGRVRRLAATTILPILLFTLVFCVFVGSVRYRIPLMPLLAVCAAQLFATTARRPERSPA